MSDDDETGFDAVLAGAVYVAPEPTATVTEEDPPATPTQISDATKALVQLPPLTMVDLAKLAREVAMDIKETHAILKDFGLTQVQYDFLEVHNTIYKNALEAACIEWHAPLSTKERVAVAAAAILEDSLPTLGARMQNRGEGLPGVIEAAKFFAKAAGIGERDHSGPPTGERFVINIDLGGDQKVVLQAGDPPGQALPAPASAAPLRATGLQIVDEEVSAKRQAEGSQTPVRHKPEGS